MESVKRSCKFNSNKEQEGQDNDEDFIWLRMNIYNVRVGVWKELIWNEKASQNDKTWH